MAAVCIRKYSSGRAERGDESLEGAANRYGSPVRFNDRYASMLTVCAKPLEVGGIRIRLLPQLLSICVRALTRRRSAKSLRAGHIELTADFRRKPCGKLNVRVRGQRSNVRAPGPVTATGSGYLDHRLDAFILSKK